MTTLNDFPTVTVAITSDCDSGMYGFAFDNIPADQTYDFLEFIGSEAGIRRMAFAVARHFVDTGQLTAEEAGAVLLEAYTS